MLVLTRRPGQSVYIGDDVKITLVEIKGNQVRLGVEAPSSVRIFREEIYLQIMEENKSAAALSKALPSDLKNVASAWSNKKPSHNFSKEKEDASKPANEDKSEE